MLRRLVPLLAAVAAAGEPLRIEAPGSAVQLAPGGAVTIAGQGFVARQGDWLLSGEALRWDQGNDALWASGGIIMVLPQVRIHAARIGMRPGARTGDAWEVAAWVTTPKATLRITAERVELRPDRLTFRDAHADFGHGGLFAVDVPAVHIGLREEPEQTRGERDPGRYVDGIALVRPTASVAGVPVLWLPYLYRDFVLDYPWSTLEAGRSDRLGWWARYRVGTNLPPMAGWRTWVEARIDRHARAGNGGGLGLRWLHDDLGEGSALAYLMPRERVADPADEGRQGGIRQAEAYDAQHRVAGRGWAAAARYTALPDADPSQTLADGRSPDERFRADVLRRELEEQPFARQGASGAWTTPWAAIAAESERRPNDDRDETERLASAAVLLQRIAIAGPLGASARGRAERLRQEVRDTMATRLTWEGRAAADAWLGGLGFDAAGGARGVAWAGQRLAGNERTGSDDLTVPFAEGGASLRLVGTIAGDGALTVQPRLGVELLARARGANPGFDFRDGADRPDADRRYGVTGADLDLAWGGARFSASARARWALRDDDRLAIEFDGSRRQGDSTLADLTFSARGSPHPDAEVVADGTWDDRLGRWTAFDTRARWRLGERVEALYNGAYAPPAVGIPETWLHRAGGSLHLERYRLDGWLEFRPEVAGRADGRTVDLWHAGFARRMVDGIFSFGYDNVRDPDGETDHRISAGFALGGAWRDAGDPARRAFGF